MFLLHQQMVRPELSSSMSWRLTSSPCSRLCTSRTCVLVPLYLVTTVELRHCGSWKVTVSVVLLLTLRRTTDGASGATEQGHRITEQDGYVPASRAGAGAGGRRLTCVLETRPHASVQLAPPLPGSQLLVLVTFVQ